MRSPSSQQKGKSMNLPKVAVSCFSFAFHQILGTFGTEALSGIVAYSAAPVLQKLAATQLTSHKIAAALTETPGFPIQVTLALILGLLVNYLLKRREAQWVWVLPVAVLICWMIFMPLSVLESRSLGARF